MLATSAFVVFLFVFPALALAATERRVARLDKVGPAVMCYAVGLAVGNLGIIPAGAAAVREGILTGSVIVAIPLLFFSLDVRSLARAGARALLSFALQTLAVLLVVCLGLLVLGRSLGAEGPKVAGMLIGVYTGGTVNLAAIAAALRVDPALYVAANASDILISGVYLLFLMTAGKGLIRAILATRGADGSPEDSGASEGGFGDASFRGLLQGRAAWEAAGSLGLALIIAGAGGALGLAVPGVWGSVVAVLAVTTLGLAASTIAAVRRIRASYALGHYLILVFSLAVGSTARLATLMETVPVVAAWVALAIFGSLVIHAALGALFGVDADTLVITSVAAICSPPFVPMVASSLGNRRVIAPGVLTGVLGWMIGTYLGVGVALALGAAG